MERITLNQNFLSDVVNLSYPNIYIDKPDDAIALVLPQLEKGEVPVILNVKGTKMIAGKIRLGIRNLSILSRMYCVNVSKDADTVVTILCGEDIFEAV